MRRGSLRLRILLDIIKELHARFMSRRLASVRILAHVHSLLGQRASTRLSLRMWARGEEQLIHINAGQLLIILPLLLRVARHWFSTAATELSASLLVASAGPRRMRPMRSIARTLAHL